MDVTKVIQVYLPTYVTETVLYSGLSQPLLRYYERLVAVHLSPVIYKDLSRTPAGKVKARLSYGLRRSIEEIGYHKVYAAALAMAAMSLAYALGRAGVRPKWLEQLIQSLKKIALGEASKFDIDLSNSQKLHESLLQEDDKNSDKMFTEIRFGKNFIIQFISVPLSISDINQIFKTNSKKELEVAKQKAFTALSTLEISDSLDVKPYVFTKPAIICSVEEVDEIKEKVGNREVSLIVVDTVNEIVIAKIIVYGKVFKYSVPLQQVVKTAKETSVSLEKLASMLKGIKLGATI